MLFFWLSMAIFQLGNSQIVEEEDLSLQLNINFLFTRSRRNSTMYKIEPALAKLICNSAKQDCNKDLFTFRIAYNVPLLRP